MTQPYEGHFVRCQPLNDVVYADIRRTTNKDTLFVLEELEDQLDESVSLAGL